VKDVLGISNTAEPRLDSGDDGSNVDGFKLRAIRMPHVITYRQAPSSIASRDQGPDCYLPPSLHAGGTPLPFVLLITAVSCMEYPATCPFR
jgi:hypothetical protein